MLLSHGSMDRDVHLGEACRSLIPSLKPGPLLPPSIAGRSSTIHTINAPIPSGWRRWSRVEKKGYRK